MAPIIQELEGILAVLEKFDDLGYEGDGVDEAMHRLAHLIQELRDEDQSDSRATR